MSQNTILGHPKGLFILFFAEMWERFSFYGMRAILVLYLTAKTTSDNPGLGWDNASALELYGWYGMLVYMMSIPGGLLADRLLGQKKSVLLGGILIILGQFVLAIEDITAFYCGLALIISGVGALKPNISTLVGGLYKAGDIKRDAGFTLFYIGINIGAFTAPLLVGYYGEKVDWQLGFSLAGFGMILGQVVFVFGQKHLLGIGDAPKKSTKEEVIPNVPLTKIEKDRMVVLLLSFLIMIVFWGAYEQAGGFMNLYAKQTVDRVVFGYEIPASFLQSLHAFYVILIGVPMAGFWLWWKKKGKEASAIYKMAIGTIVMGFGFMALMGAAYDVTVIGLEKAPLYWMLIAYLLHVVGELSSSPVALSFITKLAPAKYASFMMGAYFAVTGLGNKLAGIIGEAAEKMGALQVFTAVTIFCLLFGLLLLVFVKKLKALTHGAEEDLAQA
ncbi:MAG: peptide MFS transporter [Salibacteraceae bacterium]|jgi:proton-dependent oligopeptide transporter, POT family|nr:peptide MFS transporter [Salibacteraceae bacterium]MDP4686373.1 peptide MFS transporter [Salibacteraceae bacterium]MDP4935677.1 peptide MFS transporter [Salibacteraceae bacterium]MDP4963528.1 peptide MFS transporter [Salibacteraceae bacterium]